MSNVAEEFASNAFGDEVPLPVEDGDAASAQDARKVQLYIRKPTTWEAPSYAGVEREIAFENSPLLICSPAIDTSLSYTCPDEINVKNDVVVPKAGELECAAVVVQSFHNYSLLATPLRQIKTLLVRRKEWRIPKGEELPLFGSWWRLEVAPIMYTNECKKRLNWDVSHVAVRLIDYIPPEIHPFDGYIRGFAGIIEMWLKTDLSGVGTVEQIYIGDTQDKFIYLINTNQHGLQVIVPKERLEPFIDGPRHTRNITIAFWALLTMETIVIQESAEEVDSLPYKLKLQKDSELFAVLPDGRLFKMDSEDDAESWWSQFESHANNNFV